MIISTQNDTQGELPRQPGGEDLRRLQGERADPVEGAGAAVSGASADRDDPYRALFEDAGDAMFIAASDGSVLEINRAAEELFGFTRAALVEHGLSGTFADPAAHPELARELAAAGFCRDLEVELPRSDGAPVPCLVTASARSIGAATLHHAVIRDRTQLAAVPQLLHASKTDAIERLAGGVAHDFNNLLTVIAGHSQLMMFSLAPDDPLREDIEEIQKAAERASELTRQLSTIARKQPVELQTLDLNQVVAGMNNMLRRVLGETIELVTLPAAELRPVRIDRGHLEQAIANLAMNARDAMERGGKLILETDNVELGEAYAQEHADAAAGSFVMLAVSDSGVGMAQTVKERLFEPFFTTKERRCGTGLGLAAVYGIVRQAGGHIDVHSEAGRGTTFKIFLPSAGAEPAAASPVATRGRPG